MFIKIVSADGTETAVNTECVQSVHYDPEAKSLRIVLLHGHEVKVDGAEPQAAAALMKRFGV